MEGLRVPLVDQFRRNFGDSLSAFFARHDEDERLNGNGIKRCLPGAAPDRELREEDREDEEDATLRSSVLELRSIGLTDATEPERCVFLIGQGYTIHLYYSFQELYKELRTACLTALLLKLREATESGKSKC